MSGFGHSFWPAIEQADPNLIKDNIRAVTVFGNQNLVADVDGTAVGILAGSVGIGPRAILSGLLKNAFGIFPKFAFNEYNASRKALKHMQLVIRNYLPFSLFKMPYSRPFCEVLLFTLDKKYRGRGIGRMMMDEYINRARAGGGKWATVCTDTTASWQFYPSYGFKRIVSASLNDCFAVALPNEEVEGYIYSIKL
ncbi:MAG: GNAT family N-acetyltransferase [Kiritimatiellaceae bacterium]|nr:GNAT family N-acetyltransferase [Kiritimatiellaceae bacterium]